MHLQQLIVDLLPEEQSEKVKYVIGFILRGVPVEHAFLKIGDLYFDPTLDFELTVNDDNYELLTLTKDEVSKFTEAHGTQDHGVIMLSLRNSDDHKHLFNANNEVIMLEAIQKILDSDIDETYDLTPNKMTF